MQAYVMPVFIALSICFVLASFLTLPWAVYQYRKHGYFSFWRTLLILSFIFYGLSAFFLVIFPLPSARNNCASMDPGTILLNIILFNLYGIFNAKADFIGRPLRVISMC